LVLVVLPLVIPVMLAAAECTRLAVESRIDDQWWRWIQLLGAFSIVFVTAGALLFEYAIED
jgi:ABC-type transport system involved in cytochrome c biogenesis permease component